VKNSLTKNLQSRDMLKAPSWEVYIIQTKSGKFYTGITVDLDKRFAAHKAGTNGARFFRFSEPEQIVFRESHPNRSQATKREIEIKKMTRQEKLFLISEQKERYINSERRNDTL